MAAQTQAKDAGDNSRYQQLQKEIEALAVELGWPPYLVLDGPFKI